MRQLPFIHWQNAMKIRPPAIWKEKHDFHIGNIAGRLIAQFGEAGLHALEPLVFSPDDEIRHRVICGVSDLAFIPPDKKLKAKARKLLEKCLEVETDPR